MMNLITLLAAGGLVGLGAVLGRLTKATAQARPRSGRSQ